MNKENQIYTTGAYLKPLKTVDANGKDIWVWYATEFSETSFYDGLEIELKEFSDSEASLIKEISDYLTQ